MLREVIGWVGFGVILVFTLSMWYMVRTLKNLKGTKKSKNASGLGLFSKANFPYTAVKLGFIDSPSSDDVPIVTVEKGDYDYCLSFKSSNGFQDPIIYKGKGRIIKNLFPEAIGEVKETFDSVANEVKYYIPLVERESFLDNVGRMKWSEKMFRKGLFDEENPWVPDVEAIPIGVTSEESEFTLDMTKHTLLIGASGAGKGSVIWSLIGCLAYRDDSAIFGIDVKGGMEFNTNPGVFNRLATNIEDSCSIIETFHYEMKKRQAEMAGKSRKLVATHEQPYCFLFIDEVNSLMLNLNDTKGRSKEERERLVMATRMLNEILNEGRATGFFIFAAGQNPRKNLVPTRESFQQFIGLRVNRPMEQNLLFSDSTSFAVENLSSLSPKTDQGRGLMYDSDLGRYVAFKAYYPTNGDISAIPTLER